MSLTKITTEAIQAPARTPGLRTWLRAWIQGPTLGRDICIVLCIKLVLLMALKYAFFDHPQAEHMSMPPSDVAAHLLSIPNTESAPGDRHDK